MVLSWCCANFFNIPSTLCIPKCMCGMTLQRFSYVYIQSPRKLRTVQNLAVLNWSHIDIHLLSATRNQKLCHLKHWSSIFVVNNLIVSHPISNYGPKFKAISKILKWWQHVSIRRFQREFSVNLGEYASQAKAPISHGSLFTAVVSSVHSCFYQRDTM